MPSALVIRTAGTNCDQEMVRAFFLAGAAPDLVHLDALIADPARIDGYDLIGFPGGFSYGDDVGAGRVQAARIREHLLPALASAVDRGVPMIGACNGFQALVQTGLLPGPPPREWDGELQPVALATNAGGRFMDQWVRVEFESESVCVWTKDLGREEVEVEGGGEEEEEEEMLPIAHGEGRFVATSDSVIADLERRGQVVLRYKDNVNGSMSRIAGICDATGRVFGLMPHPERFLSWHNHPYWTRLPEEMRRTEPLGLRIFRNAVAAARTVSVR